MAITQDWLATSPLAPWLFLSFHFFPFFHSLFFPLTINLSPFRSNPPLSIQVSLFIFLLCFLNSPGPPLYHTPFFSFSQGPNYRFLFLSVSVSPGGGLFHIPPSAPLVHHTSSSPTPSSFAFITIASNDRAVKIRSVRGNTQTVTTVLLPWQQDALGRGDHYSAHPFRSAPSGLSASWGDVGVMWSSWRVEIIYMYCIWGWRWEGCI